MIAELTEGKVLFAEAEYSPQYVLEAGGRLAIDVRAKDAFLLLDVPTSGESLNEEAVADRVRISLDIEALEQIKSAADQSQAVKDILLRHGWVQYEGMTANQRGKFRNISHGNIVSDAVMEMPRFGEFFCVKDDHGNLFELPPGDYAMDVADQVARGEKPTSSYIPVEQFQREHAATAFDINTYGDFCVQNYIRNYSLQDQFDFFVELPSDQDIEPSPAQQWLVRRDRHGLGQYLAKRFAATISEKAGRFTIVFGDRDFKKLEVDHRNMLMNGHLKKIAAVLGVDDRNISVENEYSMLRDHLDISGEVVQHARRNEEDKTRAIMSGYVALNAIAWDKTPTTWYVKKNREALDIYLSVHWKGALLKQIGERWEIHCIGKLAPLISRESFRISKFFLNNAEVEVVGDSVK